MCGFSKKTRYGKYIDISEKCINNLLKKSKKRSRSSSVPITLSEKTFVGFVVVFFIGRFFEKRPVKIEKRHYNEHDSHYQEHVKIDSVFREPIVDGYADQSASAQELQYRRYQVVYIPLFHIDSQVILTHRAGIVKCRAYEYLHKLSLITQSMTNKLTYFYIYYTIK